MIPKVVEVGAEAQEVVAVKQREPVDRTENQEKDIVLLSPC